MSEENNNKVQDERELNIVFATAFYHANGNAVNMKATTDKFDKYYKCMIVLFSTIRQFYNKEKCIIFTDSPLPDKYNKFLIHFNIEVNILTQEDINFVNSFDNKFPGCLFTLDIIHYFNKISNHDEVLCLLDSDIVMQRSLDDMLFDNKYIYSLVGIVIDYEYEKKINGYSRKDLNFICNSYTGENISAHDFKYYGGEFYLISKRHMKILCENIMDLSNFLKSNEKLHNNDFTEEHILTIILNKYSDITNSANKYIKRVWTSDRHHNIDHSEIIYSLLHLPAEKDKFLNKLFNLVENDLNYFEVMDSDSYITLMNQPIQNRMNPTFTRSTIIYLKKVFNFIRKK